MTKVIPAVFEEGIIRPLKRLPLLNHQKIELQIEIPESIVKATKTIIYVRNRIGKLLAESPHLSPLGS